MRRLNILVVVALTGLGVGGCGGVELSVLAAGALSAGAGSAVKAGTEYTLTGSAYRTFSLPLEDLAAVVRAQLERSRFSIDEAVADGYQLVIVAGGINRSVHLRLTPISLGMTRLKVAVTRRGIFHDRATASEIIGQIERSVAHLNSTADLR